VHGEWRPCDPRPREDVVATLRAALPQILQASDSGAIGLVVAAEMGIEEAYTPLVAILGFESLLPSLRARGIGALGRADNVLLNRAIERGLQSDEQVVRIAARELLAQRFPARAVEQLREVVSTGTISERQAAMKTLARLDSPESREVVGAWLSRVEDGSCPAGLMLDVLEAARRSSDARIVERVKAYEERIAGTTPLAAFAACLEGGDADSGRRVFEENVSLSCRRCHSRTSGEQFVGPNLSDVGLRRSRSELLESIVLPNAKITDGFQTTTMMLNTGKVISGILRHEDNEHAVLVDGEGKEVVVELGSIEDRLQGLSAMPEGLAKQMTPSDLRDLVEYLNGLRAPPDPDRALPAIGTHGDGMARPSAGD
jgi:quinoprotein glucose dehydrogenase